MSRSLRIFVFYSAVVLVVAVAYYVYVVSTGTPGPERETFLSDIGEGIGEVALWAFVAIYARTALKLLLGKGPLARRLLPDYAPPVHGGAVLQRFLAYLDRTHVYLGIAAAALTLIHIGLMGLHPEIWFFPVVLALIVWQTAFGFFLRWRRMPRDVKRWSYSVHAQLTTGVAISIFAYFGHLLLES